ncbi:NADP-dependent oxidoreductase [Sphingomonas oryzagri]
MLWRIAARPTGRKLTAEDFTRIDDPAPEPLGANGVRVRTLLLSCDPAQKGWMENAGGYAAPTEVGDVMPAFGIAQVIESSAPGFAAGDFVEGSIGWRHEGVLAPHLIERIDASPTTLPLHLGALGGTGLTAYFGMLKVGRPFPGDTVVVTGAAGAVGSVAGQIAKIGGCRVIGIAGGPDKCRWLTDELGFDAAIDYREGDVGRQLKDLAPGGIDLLWDNVGGEMLDKLLARMAMHARVVICGGIARYEQPGRPAGPSNYFNIVFKRATMGSFITSDYEAEYAAARARLAAWVKDGRLIHREDMAEGLENAPETLMRLYRGDNVGKLVLKVADPV